jgi:murein DD-endopeptidase MepM/ murein hydrolase activator NlpD
VRAGLVALAVLAAIAPAAAAEPFRAPVEGGRIEAGCGFDARTCAYPYHHAGEDWLGTTAVAAADGRVVAIQPNDGRDQGLGLAVILRHETPTHGVLYSLYAHLSALADGVEVGACLPAGAPIGRTGGTGDGRPDRWERHLHFEVKVAPVPGTPSGSGAYVGYTPRPAAGYGYIDPQTLYGRVAAVACPASPRPAGDGAPAVARPALVARPGPTIEIVRGTAATVTLRLTGAGCPAALRPTAAMRRAGFDPGRAVAWPSTHRRSPASLPPARCGAGRRFADYRLTFFVPADTPPGRYPAGSYTVGGATIGLRVRVRSGRAQGTRQRCLWHASRLAGAQRRAAARQRCRAGR